jgi:hypothetical protein
MRAARRRAVVPVRHSVHQGLPNGSPWVFGNVVSEQSCDESPRANAREDVRLGDIDHRSDRPHELPVVQKALTGRSRGSLIRALVLDKGDHQLRFDDLRCHAEHQETSQCGSQGRRRSLFTSPRASESRCRPADRPPQATGMWRSASAAPSAQSPPPRGTHWRDGHGRARRRP